MHRAAVPARARRGLLRPLPAMDLPFLILVLTLVGFGLVMLYSASSAVALYRRGDAWAYVRPQLLYAAMGIGAMWAASRVDYHIYHKLAWPLRRPPPPARTTAVRCRPRTSAPHQCSGSAPCRRGAVPAA